MRKRTRRRRYTRTQKCTSLHTHMFTRTYTHASYAHKQHTQVALKHRIHRRTNTNAHTHTTHTHTRTPARTQLPTHPHTHTHPFLFITHTHTHAHTHTHVHTHTRTHTHTHKHSHIHLHTYTHAHACTHTHTCTHMHIHACTRSHIHTHTHTQESLADEKVAWNLASDHVLPQDVSPAVPSNAKPFTLRSPQPNVERARFERRTEGKQHDPSGFGEQAGGAVVKTGRKSQQAHEWKEQARPPSPRSSSPPGSAQLAINISSSSPTSSTGSSAKEPGNISEAAHTSTQEADKQRTAGMEEPPISYSLNEKWLENGPKGKGGGEKVIKERVSQNQRVEINNLQKKLAVVEDQVDYLPDVLCVAVAASIPPPPLPPLPPPLPFPHPPTPSASCSLLLLLPIPTHLPVSRGFSWNSPRSAHVRASCTQATQVEGDSPVSSRMHALQAHSHQLLSANLTSARNSSIPSSTANEPAQEHENRLVCALQCVAVCCSVLRCGAVCCGVVQRVAVLLQCSRNGDYRHQSRLVCVCIRLFVLNSLL